MQIKVGDKVRVDTDSGYRIVRIVCVTKDYVVCDQSVRYNKETGAQLGGGLFGWRIIEVVRK
jgi:hypothetical protein